MRNLRTAYEKLSSKEATIFVSERQNFLITSTTQGFTKDPQFISQHKRPWLLCFILSKIPKAKSALYTFVLSASDKPVNLNLFYMDSRTEETLSAVNKMHE